MLGKKVIIASYYLNKCSGYKIDTIIKENKASWKTKNNRLLYKSDLQLKGDRPIGCYNTNVLILNTENMNKIKKEIELTKLCYIHEKLKCSNISKEDLILYLNNQDIIDSL